MRYTIDFDVQVPMRDGAHLATHIWRPEIFEPCPVLLVRTPYSKDEYVDMYGYLHPNLHTLLRSGYAIAWQDCRGTFRSGHGFVPLVSEADDGEDTITWLAEQDWCDGAVGMYGASYMGYVQWSAAARRPHALKAIAPAVSSADWFRSPFYSPGGALSLGFLINWFRLLSNNDIALKSKDKSADQSDLARLCNELDGSRLATILPIGENPAINGAILWGKDVLEHVAYDSFWRNISPIEQIGDMNVPVLTVAGWFDNFLGESLRAHDQRTQTDATSSYLVIGPWSHSNVSGEFPEISYGGAASPAGAGLTDLHVRFFDRWLRGRLNALAEIAPVRIFVMGINEWRNEEKWPLPDATSVDFHLGGEGPANGRHGVGCLSIGRLDDVYIDEYLYDPFDPVPTVGGEQIPIGGGFNGPADQQLVEDREDVLVYTSPVLDEAIEVTGPVSATLFISTSCVDTDFTAKLVDVHPDGRALLLCDGITRLSRRDSTISKQPVEPNTVYRISIELGATSNVFACGHRIRLEVSSSNFPRYDRNGNSGGDATWTDTDDLVVASNRIHRGPKHPSSLLLPIINR